MNEEGLLALLIVMVPVVLLYGFALVDATRRRIGIPRKLGWVVAILLLPGVGVLAYYAMRPITPPSMDDETTGIADAVDVLRSRWESGDLDDSAYLRAKQQLFRV